MRQDYVRFGERVERPPDLARFSKQLTKRKKDNNNNTNTNITGRHRPIGTTNEDNDSDGNSDGDDNGDDDNSSNKKKRRHNDDNISTTNANANSGNTSNNRAVRMSSLIDSLDGGVSVGTIKGGGVGYEGIIHSGGGSSSGKVSIHEMEQLRERVLWPMWIAGIALSVALTPVP